MSEIGTSRRFVVTHQFVYALREGMVGFFDGMAEQMVNFVYPMWSQVIDNDEFDKMVEASPTASRKASAN